MYDAVGAQVERMLLGPVWGRCICETLPVGRDGGVEVITWATDHMCMYLGQCKCVCEGIEERYGR